MPEPTQPKRRQAAVPRRPGAPKGNLNALKHGLYSSRISPDGLFHPKPTENPHPQSSIPNSQSEIPNPSSTALENEIAMLRDCMQRVYQLSQQAADPQEILSYINTIANLSNALTRMVRAQHLLAPPEDERWAAFQRAVAGLTAGWPYEDAPYPSSPLTTMKNNLNPSPHLGRTEAGLDATDWELTNNAWDSPDPDLDPLQGLDDGFDETENGLEAPNDDLAASNPYPKPKSQILDPQFEIPPPHPPTHEIPSRPLDPFDHQPKSKFIY